MTFNLSYLISLVVYTLGALAFCVLVTFYLGEYRRRRASRSRVVLPVFTLVCAAAFLSNLLYQGGILQSAGLVLVRNLAAGLAPPLMLHLIYEIEARGLADTRPWKWTLTAFYITGVASALARALNETGWLFTSVGDALYHAPAALLAATAVLGILLQAASRRPLRSSDRARRRRMLAVLVLILLCVAVSLAGVDFVAQVPDYLLLLFFCLNLYHRERLVFIDLLVKGGTYLAVGIAILASCLAAGTFFLDHLPATPLYALAMFILAFWLVGPWVYARVARTVDRRWLCRPYSAADAERQFIREIQVAASEEELRVAAGKRSEDDSVSVELEQNGARLGSITLAERPNGIPFLSDDRRLLQSLAGALILALENVRFRGSPSAGRTRTAA